MREAPEALDDSSHAYGIRQVAGGSLLPQRSVPNLAAWAEAGAA